SAPTIDNTGLFLLTNLHLLFWLSLVPFVTGWMGENHFAPLPTAIYGAVMLLAGVAYLILQKTIVAQEGMDSKLAAAVGKDVKGKLSLALYIAAIPSAFVSQWISEAIYVLVAMMWLIPDKRIESKLNE
ncbi:MAG: TMEM175 family protein, partial [Blastocatellia bacterium]